MFVRIAAAVLKLAKNVQL